MNNHAVAEATIRTNCDVSIDITIHAKRRAGADFGSGMNKVLQAKPPKIFWRESVTSVTLGGNSFPPNNAEFTELRREIILF
jgi:hypothetical protein